jgi:SnoaL-like domain
MNTSTINRLWPAEIQLFTIIIGLLCCIVACSDNKKAYTTNQLAAVRDSVQIMTESIARDVSGEGPVAWLKYFENTPDFFMASEGRLVFPNSDSATAFIKNILVKSISKIELRWDHIRIDPLTTKLAGVSANFHEDIIDPTGKKIVGDGYFTGIAEETSQGWKLRNAHWSVISEKK